MRESPALDVLELLHRRGADLSYTDPHVPFLEHGDLSMEAVPEDDASENIDCAVICTNHSVFRYAEMPKRFPLVVDTRNALKNMQADNVFRL